MRKFSAFILTLMIAIALTACGGDDEAEKKEESEAVSQGVDISDEEKVDEDEVVAEINGTEVKGARYNAIYPQTKMQMHQTGEDAEDLDAVKENTLEELIAQELLIQEADEQGVHVSKDQAKEEMETAKSEDEEQFNAYLKQFQLTEDMLTDQIWLGMLVEKYMDEEISIDEVTNDEVKKTYEQLQEESEQLPDFEELKDDLKEQLEVQKKTEKLQEKLDELKKDATIEKKI
ncbi:MAG TPA: SurA N-terminal domain-containing protein [Bacillota bacterium]